MSSSGHTACSQEMVVDEWPRPFPSLAAPPSTIQARGPHLVDFWLSHLVAPGILPLSVMVVPPHLGQTLPRWCQPRHTGYAKFPRLEE